MRLVQVISDYIRRSILTTQGDMVVRGVSQPERLAAGADRTYLRGQGAGVIPAYEAEPTIPAMSAYRTTVQAIPHNAWTVIELNLVYYDTTNAYSPTLHKWRCPETGLYLICISLRFETIPDGTKVGTAIRLDGGMRSPFLIFIMGGAERGMCGASDVKYITIDQEVRLLGYQNSGGAINLVRTLNTYPYLTIHKLS